MAGTPMKKLKLFATEKCGFWTREKSTMNARFEIFGLSGVPRKETVNAKNGEFFLQSKCSRIRAQGKISGRRLSRDFSLYLERKKELSAFLGDFDHRSDNETNKDQTLSFLKLTLHYEWKISSTFHDRFLVLNHGKLCVWKVKTRKTESWEDSSCQDSDAKHGKFVS